MDDKYGMGAGKLRQPSTSCFPYSYTTPRAGDLPLLTAEQEQQYGRRVQSGDLQARSLLIQHNLRLVIALAGRYRGRGVCHEDLVSEGYLGLIRAVEKFDPTLGFRFSTYAVPWVRQAIERAIVRMGQTVRLPYAVAIEQRRLARAQADSRVVGVAELARRTDNSERRVRQLQGWQPRVCSLDALPDMACGRTATAPDTGLEREQLHELLHLWVDELAPLQQQVIRLRFGLSGQKPLSLLDTAARTGLTRNRVRQLQSSALERLGQRMHEARLDVADLEADD